MSDAPHLPGWLGPAAAGAAVLLLTSVVTGAIWTSVAGAPAAAGGGGGSIDAPVSQLQFTPDDADELLLDGDDFAPIFNGSLGIEQTQGVFEATYPETDVEPAGCAILFIGVELRGQIDVTRTSMNQDGDRYQYMTQTAVYFDDAASAAAALDEVRTALTACNGQAIGVSYGNARYDWEDVSSEFAADGDLPPTVTTHYYRGIATAENDWKRMTLMGNVIVVTDIWAGADDSSDALRIEDTLGGRGVFDAVDQKLIAAAS